MNEMIVDSNVLVVANDQSVGVSEDCTDASKQFLAQSRHRVLLLDSDDEILREYLGSVLVSKPFGLGAQFLIYVIQNQYNTDHARRVEIRRDALGGLADFPTDARLDSFDPSDRKFAVLSKTENVPVTNSVDSDWANHVCPLADNGIVVEFLCGPYPLQWRNV